MLIRALRILPLLSVLVAAQPAQDSTALARKALDLVLAGKYDEFLQMSTADVQKSLPAAEDTDSGRMETNFRTALDSDKLAAPRLAVFVNR